MNTGAHVAQLRLTLKALRAMYEREQSLDLLAAMSAITEAIRYLEAAQG